MNFTGTELGNPGNEALLLTDKGLVHPCDFNARLLIARAKRFDELHFDDFLRCVRLGARDWSDDDDRNTLCWLQAAHQIPRFTLTHTRTAVRSLADMRRRDSLFEYVMGLPEWDRTPRIEHAFVDAWGAPDEPMIRAASRNFFIAAVARALRAGSQVDNLWVFEGAQGTRKSQALRAFGGKYHAEITASLGTIDFLRELRGIWIPELSELDNLRGREASTIKHLLSNPCDRFVEKYEVHARSYPRRIVPVATTNESHYWHDPTGARRLIPIRTGDIRVDLIEETRDQWIAEARNLFDEGATWWEFPGAMMGAQDERQQVDPWEDTLRNFIDHGRRVSNGATTSITPWPTGWISSADLMREWLRLEPHQQGQGSSTRLGHVMRRLGFVPQRRGTPQERGWSRVGVDTQQQSPPEVSAEVSPSHIDA
jgi:predicted P-loop ATPase